MERFNLNDHPKIASGFNPKEAYFEGFTEKLMQQLPEKEVRVIPLYRKATVWISTVAAVLVLALGLTMYLDTDATEQPDESVVENYLAYQSNITTYDLIQQLDQQDIDELEQSLSMNEVNHDAIEEYLYDQNVNLYE